MQHGQQEQGYGLGEVDEQLGFRIGQDLVRLAQVGLYTDGLVESRTRSFDQGILAMRSILAREHGHLEAVCDALIASLAGRCEDDVTVILARIPPSRAG
jgi:hypothetical protein